MDTFSTTFEKQLQRDRDSEAYRIYREMLGYVFRMMDQWQSEKPSRYWEEELAGFEYMFDASPLIVGKLREHCYHLTGLRSYEYRRHHAHAVSSFAAKLQALKERDPRGLFVPESPALGGFGHEIDGDLINLDTLKFYESLIAMERAGLLAELRLSRCVVVEIGAGWGGFAYQMKRLVPGLTYVVVDLPPTLLFSSVYLRTLFPDANVYVYQRDSSEQLVERLEEYDFVFLPHYAFFSLPLPRVDLGINMVSFQEMTTEQVTAYLARLNELDCPALYSHNRDRSKHNPELTAVGMLLKQHFQRLEEIEVLPVPYTALAPLNNHPTLDFRKFLRWRTIHRLPLAIFKNIVKPEIQKKYSPYAYRHLIARNYTRTSFFENGQHDQANAHNATHAIQPVAL